MFISSYIIFSNVLYFSEYDIRMSSYVFLVEKGAMNEVRTQLVWEGAAAGSHLKSVELRAGGGDVTPHLYSRNCTISSHNFGSIVVLYHLVLFAEI